MKYIHIYKRLGHAKKCSSKGARLGSRMKPTAVDNVYTFARISCLALRTNGVKGRHKPHTNTHKRVEGNDTTTKRPRTTQKRHVR